MEMRGLFLAILLSTSFGGIIFAADAVNCAGEEKIQHESVDFKIDGQTISIDKSIVDSFNYLETLVDEDGELVELPSINKLTADNLLKLVGLINDKIQIDSLLPEQIVDIISLYSFLSPQNDYGLEVIKQCYASIRSQITPDLIKRAQGLSFYKKVEDIALPDSTVDINWSPDGSKYCIQFADYSVQMYDSEGNVIGGRIANFYRIYWSPDGSKYCIQFRYNYARMYDSEGNVIGGQIANFHRIDWSPDGSKYFIQFYNCCTQMYDSEGNVIGDHLDNVRQIDWSPDGSKYFIQFYNDYAQMYDFEGNVIGDHLDNVYQVDWSPDGSKYFIKFGDSSAQIYDSKGSAIGDHLDNVYQVFWHPYGAYFIRFNNGSTQMYGSEGNVAEGRIGDIYKVNWSPDGSMLFIYGGYNNMLLSKSNHPYNLRQLMLYDYLRKDKTNIEDVKKDLVLAKIFSSMPKIISYKLATDLDKCAIKSFLYYRLVSGLYTYSSLIGFLNNNLEAILHGKYMINYKDCMYPAVRATLKKLLKEKSNASAIAEGAGAGIGSGV